MKIGVVCALNLLCLIGASFPSAAQDINRTNSLYKENIITLSNAIDKAVQASPWLHSAKSSIGIAQGEQLQAGYLNNPEISVEAENIAGQRQYKGFDSAEVTYGVSQEIEIGGKRTARKNIANKSFTIAELELESVRLNLIRNVMIAYADSVAAHEQVKIAEEQKKLAAEVLQNVKKRVNAAAAPLFQKSKAEVAYSTSLIALDKAEREYNIEKQKLAVLWGDSTTSFELDSKDFFEISVPKVPTSMSEAVKDNPDYLRLDEELNRAKAVLDLEKANAIPDPKVNVGVRDFRNSGNQAFIVGLSLPIPVLNSNQGNIAKAHNEISKTSADAEIKRLELTTNLNRNYQELENAYKQAISLETSIIPAAEKSFTLARQGYKAGKFAYLEVLDAQRTLFETKEQYNSTLKQYHTSKAEVERITAIHSVNKNNQEVNHEENK